MCVFKLLYIHNHCTSMDLLNHHWLQYLFATYDVNIATLVLKKCMDLIQALLQGIRSNHHVLILYSVMIIHIP